METGKPSAGNPRGKTKRLSAQEALVEIFMILTVAKRKKVTHLSVMTTLKPKVKSEEMEALQPPQAKEAKRKGLHFVQQIIQHLVFSSIEDGDV